MTPTTKGIVISPQQPKPLEDIPRFTYRDYQRLPEGKRYEIIEGELRMSPAPIPKHQQVSRRIGFLLTQYVEAHGLGEVFCAPCDVLLSYYDIVQPDIFFIAKDRLSIIKEKNIQGAPDLAIEILSESSEEWDREHKMRLYGRFGVKEYWIVDMENKTIEQYQKAGASGTHFFLAQVFSAQETLTSSLFPDFQLPLSTVFSNLLSAAKG